MTDGSPASVAHPAPYSVQAKENGSRASCQQAQTGNQEVALEICRQHQLNGKQGSCTSPNLKEAKGRCFFLDLYLFYIVAYFTIICWNTSTILEFRVNDLRSYMEETWKPQQGMISLIPLVLFVLRGFQLHTTMTKIEINPNLSY